MTGSEGARLVRSGAYQPAGRKKHKRVYLALSFMPFMFAFYVFTPQYKLGKPDDVIEWAHRLRTWVAIIGALATTAPYIAGADFDKYGDAFFSDMFTTGIALVPVFLFAAGLLVFFTPLRWRRDTLRELRRPLLGAMLLYAITWTILAIIMTTGLFDRVDAAIHHPRGGFDRFMAAAFVWFAIYVLTATYLGVRHLFNAIDGNLLLPPVVTTVFAWWLVLQRLFWQSTVRPLWLDVLAAVVTAMVLTALSAWEVARLFRRGVMPANGPYPPLPPPLPLPQPYWQPYPQPYPPQPGPYPPPYR